MTVIAVDAWLIVSIEYFYIMNSLTNCLQEVSGLVFFFFQAEDGIRDIGVTGVQTCALPILVILVSHERSGIARWLMGSGAEQLVRIDEAPVVLVPASGTAYDDQVTDTTTAIDRKSVV